MSGDTKSSPDPVATATAVGGMSATGAGAGAPAVGGGKPKRRDFPLDVIKLICLASTYDKMCRSAVRISRAWNTALTDERICGIYLARDFIGPEQNRTCVVVGAGGGRLRRCSTLIVCTFACAEFRLGESVSTSASAGGDDNESDTAITEEEIARRKIRGQIARPLAPDEPDANRRALRLIVTHPKYRRDGAKRLLFAVSPKLHGYRGGLPGVIRAIALSRPDVWAAATATNSKRQSANLWNETMTVAHTAVHADAMHALAACIEAGVDINV